MAFIDKKEDVVQINLTQHGKYLLSKGKFKPIYYQFFDDDIIYDHKYSGTTEAHNEAESRIKTNIRLDNQYVITGVETRFENETKEIEQGLRDLFPAISGEVNEVEREKLLSFPISNMSTGVRNTPAFDLTSFDCAIHNSSSVTHLTQSGIPSKIPQIDFKPIYNLERNIKNQQPDDGTLYDDETFLIDFSKDKMEFIDKTFIELKSENVVVTVDESNVPFGRENFKIEVFEIIEGSSPARIRNYEDIFELFDIEIDDTVREVPVTKKTNRNFFSS